MPIVLRTGRPPVLEPRRHAIYLDGYFVGRAIDERNG
jgi:hypothetical protein